MAKYIFDVDGTLTPSRQSIDVEFRNWFEHFATHNSVYIVTGSDREKTLEQLGKTIYNLAHTVYQCSGNDVWQQSTNIRSTDLKLPEEIVSTLYEIVDSSKFSFKLGKHLEERQGLANFSVIGRGANSRERFAYKMWDEQVEERADIVKELTLRFPKYKFQVAGEIGIDITKHGKEQILSDFDSNSELFFFGDKCQPGGNDYDISEAIKQRPFGRVIEVKDWEHTWMMLKRL